MSLVGMVSIKINMNDNTERILRDVKYVHELKRNLIYLGMLNEMDYQIKMDVGVLKVC